MSRSIEKLTRDKRAVLSFSKSCYDTLRPLKNVNVRQSRYIYTLEK